MRAKLWTVVSLALILAMPPLTAVAGGPQNEKLEMYVLQGPADAVAEATAGLELINIQHSTDGTTSAEVVLTRREAARIRAQGIEVDFLRNAEGQTVSEQAALQAANGFTVWRSWDEPGGIQDELEGLATANPNLVRLEALAPRRRVATSSRSGYPTPAAGRPSRRSCTPRCSMRANGSASR